MPFPSELPSHDPDRWRTIDGHDDDSRTNGLRAQDAAAIIDFDPDDDSCISDIIANLLHLAHARGHDPARCARCALRDFYQEAGPLPEA